MDDKVDNLSVVMFKRGLQQVWNGYSNAFYIASVEKAIHCH